MISHSFNTKSSKSGWLQLSQKVDMGLILLVELAKNVGRGPVSLRHVADRNHVSFYFLQKVAADLRRSGIITSGRGKNGGYTLSRSPADISIKDVVEAHEGPLAVVRCLNHGEQCSRSHRCLIKPGLHFMNQTIIGTLSKTTLSDFLHPSSSWETCSK
jgi:Rrf2 family cysteine metabolism transcriptional repressor